MALRRLLGRPDWGDGPHSPSSGVREAPDRQDEGDRPPTPVDWHAEPGFAPVAVGDEPREEPGAWTAAAEAVDVTDHTVEFPALAPLPRRRAARAGRVALTLALVLGCAGAAVAATGVLRSDHQVPAPPTVSGSSVVAAARPHHGRPAHHARHRQAAHHRRARHHRRHRASRHVAPRTLVASAPAPAPAPAAAPVRHVVSSPAPKPAPQPAAQPAPEPAATKPATAPQPSASAPSGEPGRQPPPAP